jgi:outer membrane protein assembly factor BamA
MRSSRQTKILSSGVPSVMLLAFLLAMPVLAFNPIPGSAQTQSGGSGRAIPAAGAKLIEIKASGSKRFTSEQVAAASGLQLGTTVDDNILRKSARQLGETGAFNDISYSFTFTSAGMKLLFQVTDGDKFVPAHFVDFVWFGDHDLLQKLHERIPLFSGELPATGRMTDQISDVLQAMLVENAIPGHVEYLRTPAPGGQLASVDYSVANVSIRIRRIEFAGADAAMLPELEGSADKLFGRDYSHALLNTFIKQTVLAAYHDRGYLKVACAEPQPKVVQKKDASESSDDPNADPNDDRRQITQVDVVLAITPGISYKLQGWDWTGNQNIPTKDLQALLRARIGQPANTVQLEEDLRAVQQLYGSRGYVTASIKANADTDDAAGTVNYQLIVNEGPVYHMGELEFRGIDNNLTARLRVAWKIRPGDVYDVTYLKEFLPMARKLLPPTIDWDVAPHVTAIAKDRTVDVDLQYTAKAPQ